MLKSPRPFCRAPMLALHLRFLLQELHMLQSCLQQYGLQPVQGATPAEAFREVFNDDIAGFIVRYRVMRALIRGFQRARGSKVYAGTLVAVRWRELESTWQSFWAAVWDGDPP